MSYCELGVWVGRGRKASVDVVGGWVGGAYQHMRSFTEASGSARTGMQESKKGHSSARYL